MPDFNSSSSQQLFCVTNDVTAELTATSCRRGERDIDVADSGKDVTH